MASAANEWTRGLTLWQRIWRRICLLGGTYTHPDGKIEFDFEAPAGIGPTDGDEVAERKLAAKQGRERRWMQVVGAGMVGFAAYRLAQRLGDTEPLMTALLIGGGLYYLVKR